MEYLGNYSLLPGGKERRRQRQLDAYKEQQKKVKAMEKAIKDMRSWPRRLINESMYKRAASHAEEAGSDGKSGASENESPGTWVTLRRVSVPERMFCCW